MILLDKTVEVAELLVHAFDVLNKKWSGLAEVSIRSFINVFRH
jgi:hypothetical protein